MKKTNYLLTGLTLLFSAVAFAMISGNLNILTDGSDYKYYSPATAISLKIQPKDITVGSNTEQVIELSIAKRVGSSSESKYKAKIFGTELPVTGEVFTVGSRSEYVGDITIEEGNEEVIIGTFTDYDFEATIDLTE